MTEPTKMTYKERATITVLLFIVKLLNPTGYTHQIDQLKKEILELKDE